MKKSTIVVLVLAVMGSMGCVALSDFITPAEIDQQAVNYAVRAGVCDANDFDGYPNLDKANRLAWCVDDAHQLNQLSLAQKIERDSVEYAQLSDTVTANLTAARQTEEKFFGEKGLLTMGLGMAGLGGAGLFVGLMRKRAQDMTPEDVAKLLRGKDATVTQQEHQIFEIVKGVQEFLDNDATKAAGEALKEKLSIAQSASTKELVAKIKATM